MSNPKDTAFPSAFGDGISATKGLTKREYFAALALQGLLSSAPVEANLNVKGYAEASVKLSDALIEELNKQP